LLDYEKKRAQGTVSPLEKIAFVFHAGSAYCLRQLRRLTRKDIALAPSLRALAPAIARTISK